MVFTFNKLIRAARGFTPYAVLLIACLLVNALTFSATHCTGHQQDESIELCSLHKPVETGQVPAIATTLLALPFTEIFFALERTFIHIAAPIAIHPARAPPFTIF